MARIEEDIHLKLLRTQVSTLRNKGHTIKGADLPGYPMVEEINGKLPDIVSISGERKKVITEVETCKTIGIEHTKEQYKAFSRARNSNTEFHVVVPKSCLTQAKQKAKEWNTPVDTWWYSDNV